jgi:hypothetical protein
MPLLLPRQDAVSAVTRSQVEGCVEECDGAGVGRCPWNRRCDPLRLRVAGRPCPDQPRNAGVAVGGWKEVSPWTHLSTAFCDGSLAPILTPRRPAAQPQAASSKRLPRLDGEPPLRTWPSPFGIRAVRRDVSAAGMSGTTGGAGPSRRRAASRRMTAVPRACAIPRPGRRRARGCCRSNEQGGAGFGPFGEERVVHRVRVRAS